MTEKTEKEINIKEERDLKKENFFKDISDTNKNINKNTDLNMSNVMKRIKYMQSKLRHSYNQLLEENNDKKMKYKTLITEEKNNINKKRTTNKLSPLAKKILLKANRKIDEVNQSALDIVKLNYLFYLNKPSINYNNNISENKGRNQINRVRSSIIHEKKEKKIINNNNSMINESDIIKKIRNKSLIKNFIFINNNYHKQLNSAFMKFNPQIHLNNMKILLDADPSFQEDIAREKKEVENDIDFKNDKLKFKKKFLNYQYKKNRISLNNPKVVIHHKNKKNINNSLSLPKIKRKEDKEKEKEENKILNIPMQFINKLKKNKGNDFQKFKQNKINELNSLMSITSEINNLINDGTIDKKIKKFVNDYNLVKYEAENKRHDNVKINLSNIDYFKPEKSAVDKKLESFYIKKYFNSVEKKEKNLINKLHSELQFYNNQNLDNRDESLNELDSFLFKNNINIIEQKKS